MKINLYLENGYLNMPWLLGFGMAFNVIVGGRGVGKTYGALKFCYESNFKFMYSRRLEKQIDLCATQEFNPWKKLNSDYQLNVGAVKVKTVRGLYAFYNFDEDGKPSGVQLGLAAALNTFSSLRGIDGSDLKLWFIDEFIKEPNEKTIKGEGTLFKHAYETLNRNREFQGEKPLQAILCANSNSLDNDILYSFGIVSKIEQMKRKGQTLSINKERSLLICVIPEDNPISMKKRETVLYKQNDTDGFADVSLNNRFAEINDDNIKSMPIKEFKPVVQIGEIFIYRHKSMSSYYCTSFRNGAFNNVFKMEKHDIDRFLRKYQFIINAYMQNRLIFETSTDEVMFNYYIDY